MFLFLWPSLVNGKRDYGVMKWSIGCVRLLYYGLWYKRPKDWTPYYLCQVSSISVLSARVFLCVCLPVWGSACVLYRSADSSINLWLLLITSLHLSLSHFIYRSTHLSLSLHVFCQFHSLSPLFALFSSCYILLGSFHFLCQFFPHTSHLSLYCFIFPMSFFYNQIPKYCTSLAFAYSVHFIISSPCFSNCAFAQTHI